MPISITVESKILRFNIKRFPLKLNSVLKDAIDKATQAGAKKIRDEFKGSPLGFRDQTGALRKSIQGGFIKMEPEGPVGVIRAGDSIANSDGVPTKDYVGKIEFGEFNRAGQTAFLRPGVLGNLKLMVRIISGMVRKRIL